MLTAPAPLWLIDQYDDHVLETPLGRYRVAAVPTNHGNVRYCASAPDHVGIGSVLNNLDAAKQICIRHFESSSR